MGALAAALTLGACTPALGEGQSGQPAFSRTGGALQILVPGDAAVAEVAAAYTEITGSPALVIDESAEEFAATSASLDEDTVNVVVWGQWGAPAPNGWDETAYGRDYSCVVADDAWFAVNRQPLPASTADLTNPQWAPLTEVPSPAESGSALRWIAGAGVADPGAIEPFLAGLKNAGVQLATPAGGSEAPQSGGSQSGDPAPPPTPVRTTEPALRIASALEPWRTVNNLGTSSRWVTLAPTCVGTELSVWAVGPKAEEFVEFLLTDEGQTALVEAGLAYPINDGVAIPEAVLEVAPPPTADGQAPVEIPPAQGPALTDAVTAAWRSVAG